MRRPTLRQWILWTVVAAVLVALAVLALAYSPLARPVPESPTLDDGRGAP